MSYKFNSTLYAAAVVSGLLFSACSGNKPDKEENKTTDVKSGEPATASATGVKTFDNVDPSVKAQINGFLSDYFALNQTLIEDNNEAAKAASKKLSETVAHFDMSKLMGEQMDFYHTQVAKLNAGLKGINQSADIEEVRTALAPVSESIYALVKAYQPNSTELVVKLC